VWILLVITNLSKMNLSMFYKALCLLLFISTTIAFGQQTERVSPDGTKFLLYLPPAYNPAVASPLLISLHGGGEIGDDLTELTSTPHQLPSRLIFRGPTFWPAARPFIVVSPQLKRDLSLPNHNDQEWPAALVDEVVEYVRANYNVDANRIYLTGISLGAAGGWDYITAYPGKVAAFVPISGKTRPENACIVKNTPIWAFHGEIDGLVRPQFTVDMISAINACTPPGTYKTRLNLLHSRGHEGWNEVYNGMHGYLVFDWLLKFTKGNNTNKTPVVNAGLDQKYY
jgi:predicted esterase